VLVSTFPTWDLEKAKERIEKEKMYWAKTEHPVISDYVEEREQCED
jgi:hypothetical protein